MVTVLYIACVVMGIACGWVARGIDFKKVLKDNILKFIRR